MSVNTANTPDGQGILLYNGEVILVFATNVTLHVNANMHAVGVIPNIFVDLILIVGKSLCIHGF